MPATLEKLKQFLPDFSKTDLRHDDVRQYDATDADPYRILIMESQKSLGRLLATGLRAESFAVEVTHDLESALKQMQTCSYSLLIVDMDLPDMDGLALLDHLRARAPETMILALSGKHGIKGLVAALDHGVDDYLPKPFSLLEMMARIRALRRRAQTTPPATAPRERKLVLHRDQYRVERDGRSIDLTPREFALLEFMTRNPGKTLSRGMLTHEVWNMPAETNTNIVDVYIKYLRDKLDGQFDEKLIRTVRGIGYMFHAQA